MSLNEKQIVKTYIRHVKQAVQTASDDFTKTIRLYVLALAEAELVRLRQKEVDDMLDELNRIGLLYHKDHQAQPWSEALHNAHAAFRRNPHTSGFQPTECCVNPDDAGKLPEEVELSDGNGGKLVVPVVVDQHTRPSHILLCLPDPDIEEPAMELAYAAA